MRQSATPRHPAWRQHTCDVRSPQASAALAPSAAHRRALSLLPSVVWASANRSHACGRAAANDALRAEHAASDITVIHATDIETTDELGANLSLPDAVIRA